VIAVALTSVDERVFSGIQLMQAQAFSSNAESCPTNLERFMTKLITETIDLHSKRRKMSMRRMMIGRRSRCSINDCFIEKRDAQLHAENPNGYNARGPSEGYPKHYYG
jgi:hypothetical protein